MNNYLIKPLEASDLDWLRKLRNQNKDAFINQRDITMEAQSVWFDRIPPDHHYYIVWDEISRTRAGSFNVVPLPDDLPIPKGYSPIAYVGGYLVHPDFRGKGVLEATNYALDRGQQYVGYIRYHNWHSIRACLRIGWKAVEAVDHPQYGKLLVVIL